MNLEQQLFEIEHDFWLGGQAEFLKHLDERCLLVFPQAGQMHGVYASADIARTATTPHRWRDLRMSNRHLLNVADDVTIISYRADVLRADGQPYAALIGSTYVRHGESWKLAAHQHSPV